MPDSTKDQANYLLLLSNAEQALLRGWFATDLVQDGCRKLLFFCSLSILNYTLQKADCNRIRGGVAAGLPGGVQLVNNLNRSLGTDNALHFSESNALGSIVIADKIRHKCSHRLHFLKFFLMGLRDAVQLGLMGTV